MKYSDLQHQPKEYFQKEDSVSYKEDGFEMFISPPSHLTSLLVVYVDSVGTEHEIDTIQHAEGQDFCVITTTDEEEFDTVKLDEEFEVRVYERKRIATL